MWVCGYRRSPHRMGLEVFHTIVIALDESEFAARAVPVGTAHLHAGVANRVLADVSLPVLIVNRNE
jgi:hypothetical protein